MEKALESGDMEAAGVALGARMGEPQGADRRHLHAGDRGGDRRRASAPARGPEKSAAPAAADASSSSCRPIAATTSARALANVPGRRHRRAAGRARPDRRARRRRASRVAVRASRCAASPSLEQLYVFGGSGDYRPYLLAEAIVTQSEPRSGVHHRRPSSAYVAPMRAGDGTRALERGAADRCRRRSTSAPCPIRITTSTTRCKPGDADAGRAAVGGCLPAVRRPARSGCIVFHNPEFAHLLAAGRVARGLPRALQRRSEAPHRRRAGAPGEHVPPPHRSGAKSAPSATQRELDNDETAPSERGQDVNVAWGQTLYNITSGKPAAVAEALALGARRRLPRQDRARSSAPGTKSSQVIREELQSKAREIEEIVVDPDREEHRDHEVPDPLGRRPVASEYPSDAVLGSHPSRAVAQPGSVPEWGSGGRGFKSPLPDQIEPTPREDRWSNKTGRVPLAHQLFGCREMYGRVSPRASPTPQTNFSVLKSGAIKVTPY